MTMINLMNWDFNTGLKPYGLQWRNERRLLQDAFRPSTTLTYRPIQTEKINHMLYELLTNPKDFRQHYKAVNAAIIMRIVYGYDTAPEEDYFVELSEAATQKLSESVFPGAALVNALPILRHLPSWLPGTGFQVYAKEAKKLTKKMRDVPFAFVKENLTSGMAYPSMVSSLLANMGDHEHEMIKSVAATSFAGGADTTTSALGTFFYAMAMFPEAQKKAQQEIGDIIGYDRLPTFDDQDSLPYIEAVFREVMRWRPVTPLGVAHSTTEDDIFNGYYIPKGATVISNIWAMAHDPDKYENPELFNPDRYFDQDGNLMDDKDVFVFGFGRRICPGRHMASATVWLAIVTVLSMFNIRKVKDASGNEIPLNGDYTDGLISHPLPYQCSVTPRSDEAARLIMETVSHKT